jgi:hypothetical protein
MVVISQKHKFIFIHIPKTAGSSITKNLINSNEKNSISKYFNLSLDGEKFFYVSLGGEGVYFKFPFFKLHRHAKAKKINQIVGDKVWDEYFTFTFVRNPWDLMVSSYCWWLQKASKWKKFHQDIDQIRSLRNYTNFLKSKYGESMINECKGNIFDWISDEDGEVIVDFVGKFENLHHDFKKICQKIGIDSSVLPHTNKSLRKSYHGYYNAETKELIHKRFKKSIDFFGYEF